MSTVSLNECKTVGTAVGVILCTPLVITNVINFGLLIINLSCLRKKKFLKQVLFPFLLIFSSSDRSKMYRPGLGDIGKKKLITIYCGI